MDLKTQSPEGNKATKPRKPLRQGASSKLKLANITSRPAKGSPHRVEGKVCGGSRMRGTGAIGPLERWLLPLGKETGAPRVRPWKRWRREVVWDSRGDRINRRRNGNKNRRAIFPPGECKARLDPTLEVAFGSGKNTG